MTRIAIIVGSKGRGSNMRGIIEACRDGRIDAQEVSVIAASRSAPAVETAESLSTKVVVLDDFDSQLLETLESNEIDLICLAGYMRLIPSEVVNGFAGRILNIHPALLPKYGGKGMWGMKVHEAVLASGDNESGCTVHFVTEHYDEGAILLQMRCPVERDDTPEILAARVLKLEHDCYVDAINKWIHGRNAST